MDGSADEGLSVTFVRPPVSFFACLGFGLCGLAMVAGPVATDVVVEPTTSDVCLGFGRCRLVATGCGETAVDVE